MAINAVSAALMCSDIPWHGPLAAVQVAYTVSRTSAAGTTVVLPTVAQLEACSTSGIYAGTANTTLLADFQVIVASFWTGIVQCAAH